MKPPDCLNDLNDNKSLIWDFKRVLFVSHEVNTNL